MDDPVTAGLSLLQAGLVAIPLWLGLARLLITHIESKDDIALLQEFLLHSLIFAGYGSLVMFLLSVLRLITSAVPSDSPLVVGVLWIRVLIAVAGWVLFAVTMEGKSLKYSFATILFSVFLTTVLFPVVRWDMFRLL